ncbi:MAG TPA: hypothetical protein VGE55_08310 [Limnobacter sp.]|uniref:hypothetical protein n=1 Tax=Limnobacter sp. TaxID=2003368 RepID=UPI002ED81E4E
MTVFYTYYRAPTACDEHCELASRQLLKQAKSAGASTTRLYRRVEIDKPYTTWMEMVELPGEAVTPQAVVANWQRQLNQWAALCFASTAYYPDRKLEVFEPCA